MAKRIVLVVLVILVCSTGAFALTRGDLDTVAARLSAAAGRTFEIRVEFDSTLNASATGDGQLMVTTAMLQALTTQDQLAFVLGHEMTHVLRKHAKSQMDNLTLGAIIGFSLGAYAGLKGDDLVLAVQAGAMLFNGQPSRDDEYEADDGGMRLVAKAGYDPQGGVQAMQLLLSRYGRGEAGIPIIGWFASHPDTKNRVIRLQTLATKLEGERPAPAPPAIPTIEAARVQAEAPPTVETPKEEFETGPADVAAVEQNPNLQYRFGDVASHALKGTETLSVVMSPSGTAKVVFRLTGEGGHIVTQGEVTNFDPAKIVLSQETLRKYGSRLHLTAVALDANGQQIGDPAEITLVTG